MSSESSDTRVRILETAGQMLERHGGRGVRMADIAKEAGISRQAVYLHFSSRAALLTATTQYRDKQLDLERRLAPSRTAKSGIQRLALYVEFWGFYIPEIYGIAKALLVVQDTDDAAKEAWANRMAAHRDGCQAVIDALAADNALAAHWSPQSATDVLWTLLSVNDWEQLTAQCGWTHQQYVDRMKIVCEQTLVK